MREAEVGESAWNAGDFGESDSASARKYVKSITSFVDDHPNPLVIPLITPSPPSRAVPTQRKPWRDHFDIVL